jgi:hypothetical protein
MMGLWLLAGALVGLLNSLAIWWTVARLRSDTHHSALLLTLGGMVLRLALIAALLIGGLKRGFIPGLLAFGGLWLTRTVVVVWIHASGVPWTCAAASGDRKGSAESQRG